MKNYYLLLFLLLGFFGKAQIINFPDANFKAKLLAASPSIGIAQNINGINIKIDINNNGEIEVSEALNVIYLSVSSSSIQSLDGISYFTNLKTIRCSDNQLSNLDLSNNLLLQGIYCEQNQLSNLSLPNNPSIYIEGLDCSFNVLTSLNVTNVRGLVCNNNALTTLNFLYPNVFNHLDCRYNLFTSLDFSSSIDGFIESLKVSDNPNLNYINFKNGLYNNFFLGFSINNCPNLSFICADEGIETNYLTQKLYNLGLSNQINLNSYCTFTPGGTFYTIQGQNKFDNENDGCDTNDGFIPKLRYSYTEGITTGSVISNNTDSYSIQLLAGSHTVTPVLENPSYFSVSPANIVVNFPTQASPFSQNFCITPIGEIHDVKVCIIPMNNARPGFDATYKIIYMNKGNQVENGTINLLFNDAVLDLVSANPSFTTQVTNNLSWTYNNLQPFETREIILVINVNSPTDMPAVNSGDVLNYETSIISLSNGIINGNTFTLTQTALNSLDPNNKTCLEGNTISPDKVGEFVHYMIRFENTGTFPAENIVVKDMIDITKFDVSSLVPLHASHNYFTKITGNKVEFIFENINLPFDDANNDGYVAFKIKTVPTLVVGDTFSNSVNIYFDYNFPIITNTATTAITALSNPSFEFANYFSLYPNPTTNELNINLKSAVEINSIQIYNTIGQLVTVQTGNALKVDVSNLKTGNYFIKINTNEGFSTSQFIKE